MSNYSTRVRWIAFLAIAVGAVAVIVRQSTAHEKELPSLLILFLAWCLIVAIVTFILLKLARKK